MGIGNHLNHVSDRFFFPDLLRRQVPHLVKHGQDLLFHVAMGELHEKLFLVLEIGVETAHGDPGLGRNALGVGTVIAVAGKQDPGCLQDTVPGLNPSFLLRNSGFYNFFCH